MITNLSRFEELAWYAGIILCLAVIVRMVALGIAGRYRALVALLVISVSRSILLASLPFNTNRYAEAYILTIPVLYLASIWLVLEIYNHAFENLRGIAMLGRWTLVAALLAGTAFAVGTTLLDHDPARETFPLLGIVFSLEVIVVKTLVAFSLLICIVLVWFPISQRRNVLLIAFGSTAWFVALAASLIVRGLNPSAWSRMASTSALYTYAVCMAVWAIALQAKSLDIPAARPIAATAEREAMLAGQLQTMNRALESFRKAG